MATPVSAIFRPVGTSIGIGSFLKRVGDRDICLIARIDSGRAVVVSLNGGNRYRDSVHINDYASPSESEFRTMAGDPNDWLVLSREEAAAELANMK